MIRIGEVGERIRWGELEITITREGDRWRAAGSFDCLIPFDPTDHDVLLSPVLPPERYYIDVEPPIVLGPGSEVSLAATLPVGVEVFLGRVRIGEFLPRLKRTYLGPTTDGVFASYVRLGESHQPGMILNLTVVNHAKETLFFDELKLSPWLLSVFEHEGEWITERLVVSMGPEEMDVKHTDLASGHMIIRGKRENEINKRFKKFVERLRDAI
ncbi:MAG: hypothetical protein ABIN58_04605 [candidate division WOR-3 bacterium]